MSFELFSNEASDNSADREADRPACKEECEFSLWDVMFTWEERDDGSKCSYEASVKDLSEGVEKEIVEAGISFEFVEHI